MDGVDGKMEEEDNMTWTMPWATADVPVASSSAVPPPPNPQQTATSAANSIPKKKSVRRSSILKTTTAATSQVDKRGPLKVNISIISLGASIFTSEEKLGVVI